MTVLYGYTPNFNNNTRNPIVEHCTDQGKHCKGYTGSSEIRVMSNGQYNASMQCNDGSIPCAGTWGCCKWDSTKYGGASCAAGDPLIETKGPRGWSSVYCQKPFGGDDVYVYKSVTPTAEQKKRGANNPVQASCRLTREDGTKLEPTNVKFVGGGSGAGSKIKDAADLSRYHVECQYNKSDFQYNNIDNLGVAVKNLWSYGNHFFDDRDTTGIKNAFNSYTVSQRLRDICNNVETNAEYCTTETGGVNPTGEFKLQDYINPKYSDLFTAEQLKGTVSKRCSFFSSDNPDLKVKIQGQADTQNICTAWAEHVGGNQHTPNDKYREKTIDELAPGHGPYTNWDYALGGLDDAEHAATHQGSNYYGWPIVSEALSHYCNDIYGDILDGKVTDGILEVDLDNLCGCEMRSRNKNYSDSKQGAELSPNFLTGNADMRFPDDGCWWPQCKGTKPWNNKKSSFIPQDTILPDQTTACTLPINACINNFAQNISHLDCGDGDITESCIEQSMNIDNVQTDCSFNQPQDGADSLPPAASPPPTPGGSELTKEEERNLCIGLLLPCDDGLCGKDYRDRKEDSDYIRRMSDHCNQYWMETDSCPPCPPTGNEPSPPSPSPPSPSPPSSPPFDFFEFIDQNTAAITTIIGILIFIVVFKIFIIPFFSSAEPNGAEPKGAEPKGAEPKGAENF